MDPVTLGAIAAGGLSLFGQERANRTSVELANTQYQRAVKDMRAAGLNPILATRIGGSAVPPIGNVAGDAGEVVSSARDNIRLRQEVANMKEQNQHIRQQVDESKIRAQTLRDDYLLRATLIPYQADLFKAQTQAAMDNAASARAVAELNKVEAQLRKYDIPGRRNEARMQETVFGKALPFIAPTARGVANMFPWFSRLRPVTETISSSTVRDRRSGSSSTSTTRMRR